jgi:uncharacterized protein YcbX
VIDGRPAAVAELWRFPVKSMRGERIDASAVSDVGLTGDRAYAVVDAETGKVGSAKHPRLWSALLQCEARFAQPPEPGAPLPPVTITLPGGDETGSADPDVDDRLSAVMGHRVHLTTGAPEGNSYLAVWPRMDGVVPDDFREQSAVEGDEQEGTVTDLSLALAATPGTFFDVSALHVVTTATIDHLGALAPRSRFAVERYRPNIVIEGAGDPFAENGWSGAALHIGDALTATVLLPTMRCIMTTLAQGDLPRDNEVLRTLTRHNRVEIPGLGTWSCVGAYAAVSVPGRVQVGDEVALARPSGPDRDG